jgi:hypothetical protein
VSAALEHGPSCSCTRCVGFQPGNEFRFKPGHELSTRHGAYARVALSERAAGTAEELRQLVVVYDPADEPALQTFAFVVEQMKAAAKALEDEDDRAARLRLSQDARGWALAGLRFAEQFGMTPRSRAALGLDLIRGQAATLTLTRLAAMADEEAAA